MTVTDRQAAPDQKARQRIVSELDTTLFVEAGAGSGKTTALVDRILSLVVTGTAALDHVAAVTFTEKAAAELRDRVRQALEVREAAADADGDEECAARCRHALDELDGAAIGTLHAFAHRILSEHPVEARLPPRIEVLDEVSSDVEFDRRWAAFEDSSFADPTLERTLLLLFAAGVRPDGLRVLAQQFNANWDLVESHVPSAAPDPRPVRPMLAPVLDSVDTLRHDLRHCADTSDLLYGAIEDALTHAARLRAIDDEVDLVEALNKGGWRAPRRRLGRSGNWQCDVEEVRARLAAIGNALDDIRTIVATECVERVGVELRRFTLGAADERRRSGRLEFHDLLVLARSLLRDATPRGAAVRRALHQRYQRLLLDEFQDTDPIQVELAVRIAAADPGARDAATLPWDEVALAPGALFVVGDPKQSIYRFRRADISMFLAARRRLGSEQGELVELTANFRTGREVIEWVNEVFGVLIREQPGDDRVPASQPAFVALEPVRDQASDPAVSVLGVDPHPNGTGADVVRAAEARDVVAAITAAIDEGWKVDDGDGGSRPARLGDIAILLPARTSLPFLEDALDDAGVPYRAESSSLVYATRAIRDLLMVVRAVDDPTDHLAVVSALRTPLFACGDDDLLRFRIERRGHWNQLAPQPDTVPPDDPVRAGLAYLAQLHRNRYWLAPSELLETIARDRFAFELGFAEGRPRDVWRRLRFVVDQARQWCDATGGSLRAYLHWVRQQTAEGARVAEAVLPETDDDAVRIMTIHAAKGLEFPITILSGLTTASRGRRSSADVRFLRDGRVGYAFGAAVRTDVYEDWKPIDEQMAHEERIRLLYVGATRARDHLVVSLHRVHRKSEPKDGNRTNAELLVAGMGTEAVRQMPVPASGRAARVPRSAPVDPPLPFDEWAEQRDAALRRASRPSTVAATALTEEGVLDAPVATGADDPIAGLQKRPRDLDLPPWLKGRYGTAVGRAVHGVLQTVDLAHVVAHLDDDQIDAAVAAQCEAEAIPDRAADVRRLVVHALGAPTVRDAAGAAHWREVYACAPVGSDAQLLEGYVDLLYRSENGLVVVDYKTAATDDVAELERRARGYRSQGASYALVVGATTGEEVARVVFVFLTPSRAVEIDLEDLHAAVAEVREELERGGLAVVDE